MFNIFSQQTNKFIVTRFLLIFISILATSLLMSCNWNRKAKQSEIAGTYIFNYPSKEVEELIIKQDSTYTKKIFASKQAYIARDNILHSNIGEWEIHHNNRGLNFKDWLEYCHAGNPDSILPKPEYVFMTGLSWRPANLTKKDRIVIFDEFGYIFEKIESGNQSN